MTANQQSIYNDLSRAGQLMARIPRIGRLIAMMPHQSRQRLTSRASTYWELYTFVSESDQDETGLLDAGLRAAEASRLGWHKEGYPNRKEAMTRRWQMRLARDMLAAVAFQMFCGERGDGSTPPLFVIDKNLDTFRNRAFDRLEESGAYVSRRGKPLDGECLLDDWYCLKQLNSLGLQHIVLSDFGERERILFTDISTQSFFAAYWAARWASDKERTMMRDWFPDPLGDAKNAYNEFWALAAELVQIDWGDTVDQPFELDRWQALFAPLYDATLVDQDGKAIRSTELIYRTWDGMQGSAAKQSFCDEFPALLCAGDRVASSILAGKRGDSHFVSLAAGAQGELDHGSFIMGAPDGEYPSWDGTGDTQRNPLHPVELSPFHLHRYCVTNLQFELFEPRHAAKREFARKGLSTDQHPVVNVRWDDAWCFAQWLGRIEFAGRLHQIALPTEAQWEYACRCGETSPFTWPDRLHGDRIESGFCNFDGNYPWPVKGESKAVDLRRTVAVDGKDKELQVAANPWGLYQMHGNVWEWCEDWYDANYYRVAPLENPSGPTSAFYRVLRGGSWINNGGRCRSGYRLGLTPGLRYWGLGFRLAAVPVEPSRSSSERSRRLGDR